MLRFILFLSFISLGINQAMSQSSSTADLFSNMLFISIFVALVGTYGVYVLGALIFFDPWHVLTSFIQYILLSPAYINVLNVFAFCNVRFTHYAGH